MKKYILERYKLKFPVNTFEKNWKKYLKLPRFKFNENIFDYTDITPEVHYIIRLATQYAFLKVFDAMKVDMDDPNVKEDLSCGNIGTAGRLAKMYCGANIEDESELGCGRFIKKPRIAVFPSSEKCEIPITKRVDLISNCSHHMIPFGTLFGNDSYAIVSYIPDKFVLGISKLQRLVNWVSKRYWLQEDLTKAIYDEVSKATNTKDVYVKLVNLKHGCEFLRGSMSKDGSFTSEWYGGKFKNLKLRESIK